MSEKQSRVRLCSLAPSVEEKPQRIRVTFADGMTMTGFHESILHAARAHPEAVRVEVVAGEEGVFF